MNIAMISYRLPFDGKKRGGIEQMAHVLAEGLSRRGHRVSLWSYDSRPRDASYEVYPLPGRRFFNTGLGRRITMGYWGNVIGCVPSYRSYDAVLVHGDSIFLPFKHSRIVRVLHGSALGEALSSSSPPRILLQLGVYLQEVITTLGPTICVAVSEGTRRYFPAVQYTIPNGIDRNVFSPGDGKKAAIPTILFVGTLAGRKRGTKLIEWFLKYIRPKFPKALLNLVCPPGPEYPGVVYHEGLSPKALAHLYRNAWILASPSLYEGFGLPYVEAMAMGTPVIATPNPGSREILADGKYGLLVDDVEFGPKMVELLADESKRQRLAVLGLERAKAFDLELMLDRYEQLLCKGRLES